MKKIIVACQDAVREVPAFMLRQFKHDHVFSSDIVLALVPVWMLLLVTRLYGMVRPIYRGQVDQVLLGLVAWFVLWVAYRILVVAFENYMNLSAIEHRVLTARRDGHFVTTPTLVQYNRIVDAKHRVSLPNSFVSYIS